MKPLQHAKISAKKHGGVWQDYVDIHEFFDQTKAHVPDMRHRAILHNSFGIFLARQQFGEVRVNSAGREYSVRDIGEDHVLEDLGTIPTLAEVIQVIPTSQLKWLGGLPKNQRTLVARIPKKRPQKAQEPTVTVKCEHCEAENPSATPEPLRIHTEDCPVLRNVPTLDPEKVKMLLHEGAELGKVVDQKIKVMRQKPSSYPDRDMIIDGASRLRSSWKKRNQTND